MTLWSTSKEKIGQCSNKTVKTIEGKEMVGK